MITNLLVFLIQTDEHQPGDLKDGGRDPLAGEREEDQGRSEKEMSQAQVSEPEQETVAGDDPQLVSTRAGDERSGAEDDTGKPSTDADKKEEKDEEDTKEKNSEGVKKCDGAEGKTEKEQLKTEGGEKEDNERAKGGVEKQNQNDLDKAKDKPQTAGAEKQGKTKKKSGPPSSFSRPRTSARTIRSSAKKDNIAKFQQGAPE